MLGRAICCALLSVTFSIVSVAATRSTKAPLAVSTNQVSTLASYQEKVIAFSAGAGPDGSAIVRNAYLALERGRNSQAAGKAGGLSEAVFWVDDMELAYEGSVVMACLKKEASDDPLEYSKIPERLSTQPLSTDLASDAERFAHDGYKSLLEVGGISASTGEKSHAAIQALFEEFTRSKKRHAIDVTGAIARFYLGEGSNGKCPASPHMVELMQKYSSFTPIRH